MAKGSNVRNIKFPKENPPIGEKSKIKIIIIPIEPKERYALACFSGSIRENILDPSRGGIGIKLKIAKRRFKCTIKANSI